MFENIIYKNVVNVNVALFFMWREMLLKRQDRSRVLDAVLMAPLGTTAVEDLG